MNGQQFEHPGYAAIDYDAFCALIIMRVCAVASRNKTLSVWNAIVCTILFNCINYEYALVNREMYGYNHKTSPSGTYSVTPHFCT